MKRCKVRNPSEIPPFLDWLRIQMQGFNISQMDLKKKLGVSKSTVSLWLNGARLPSAANKEKLAKTLHGLGSNDKSYTSTRDELLMACHEQELHRCIKPSS